MWTWLLKKLAPIVKQLVQDELQSIREVAVGSREWLGTGHRCTAESVVQGLVGGDFKWFDYTTLPQADWKNYFDQAQYILRSEVFQNEIARLNAEWAEWSLKKSGNFEAVSAMRHQISGINLLNERFESIPNPMPPLPAPAKEPFEGI